MKDFRMHTRLNDGYAMTVKDLPLIGPVRIVIARVAIANSQNPAAAAKLEGDAVIGVRNQPALSRF